MRIIADAEAGIDPERKALKSERRYTFFEIRRSNMTKHIENTPQLSGDLACERCGAHYYANRPDAWSKNIISDEWKQPCPGTPDQQRIHRLETAISDHLAVADEMLEGKGEHAGCWMEKRRFDALRTAIKGA